MLLNRILTTEHGKRWQAAIVGFLVLFFALLITMKRALSGMPGRLCSLKISTAYI